jgi:hypothetical protein
LSKLLELLLSEDRSKRLQSEKERIGKYIQRVNKLIKNQKQLQGEASGEADLQQIAEQQGQLAEKTAELARDIADSEGDSKGKKRPDAEDKPDKPAPEKSKPDKAKPKKSPDGKPGDKPDGGKSDDGKPGEGQPSENQPGKEDSPQEKGDPASDEKTPDGEKKPADKPSDGKSPDGQQPSDGKPGSDPSSPDGADAPEKPGESGAPAEGKPGEKSSDKPSDGSGENAEPSEEGGDAGPAEDKPADDGEKNPVRERVAQAEQKMRDAQKKLSEALREQAVQKQDEARRELELAKAELEAILRQLREEEVGRTLAMLESRFRKMLELQNQVNTGTQRLDKVPVDDRDHDDEIEAGRLSRQEAAIVVEANKALAVLHDEGSAVAFPEAVSDLRDDMEQVVVRLAQAKVDTITQGLENDIVVGLEEMIAAFHSAQKQQASPQKGGQSGGETEAPLVDDLSEIKMIRSMQMWVNQRTKRYTEMTKADSPESADLIAALRRLADREQRIHRVTRDIVVGRNK